MRAKDVLGKTGEQMTAEYLQSCGLRILNRNWRSADGATSSGGRHGSCR